MTSRLDRQALGRWLQRHFPDPAARLVLEPVAGGQSNPTYFLNWGASRMVLRKKPGGPILPGAHAVEREFRVLSALTETPVPVPRPLKLEDDTSVLGTTFYVMERLEGRVFSDAALPTVAREERRGIYLAMAETLATLHRVVPEQIGLGDFGRPGSYFEVRLRRRPSDCRYDLMISPTLCPTLSPTRTSKFSPPPTASAVGIGRMRTSSGSSRKASSVIGKCLRRRGAMAFVAPC